MRDMYELKNRERKVLKAKNQKKKIKNLCMLERKIKLCLASSNSHCYTT